MIIYIALLGLSLHCFDLDGEELGYSDYKQNQDGTIDIVTDPIQHIPIDNIHDNVLYLETGRPPAICFIPPENV